MTTRRKTVQQRAPTTVSAREARALAGGRLSTDSQNSFIPGWNVILPPHQAEDQWRAYALDSRTLDRMAPAQLLELLADLSPDVSRALWDFLRLCNPGWEVKVLRPGSEDVDKVGQALILAFLDRLADLYGSVDVVFGRLFTGAFLRGALLAELVLDANGRESLDIATPDPHLVRFRQENDPIRGVVWQLGQWQAGQFVVLDRSTIRYAPIDPYPGSPYGRAIAAPALFTSLFLLGLLHDLRRVVAQQGYPRLDVEVNLTALAEAMPADLANDAEARQAWANAVIAEVQSVYSQLNPEDAYIHSDVVKVNRPVGTVDSSSLGGVDGLIKALERMAMRALKTMPLAMGTTDGVSEANANRQWELLAAGIKSLQHLAEGMLERILGLTLRAQGIAATVEFRFAELRAAEMLRDAQTEQLRIANAQAKYAAGWIDQEESAVEVTGHAPAEAEPRAATVAEAPPADAANVEADPGSNRARPRRRLGRTRAAPAPADTALESALLEDRESFSAELRADVEAYFRGLAERTEERYRERAEANERAAPWQSNGHGRTTTLLHTRAEEELKLSAEELLALLPESEAEELREALRSVAERVGAATYALAADHMGVAIAFDLENPLVEKYLAKSGERVGGILDTTREKLRAALQEGTKAGEGVPELAKRVRESVEESYRGRSATIARTEVGTSQQLAAVDAYETSGLVERVLVLDGDDFDDACRLANGQHWTLSEARARPLEHPNCVRAFAPVVGD